MEDDLMPDAAVGQQTASTWWVDAVRYDVLSLCGTAGQAHDTTPAERSRTAADLRAAYDAVARYLSLRRDRRAHRVTDPRLPAHRRPRASVHGLLTPLECLCAAAPVRGALGLRSAAVAGLGDATARGLLSLPPHAYLVLSHDVRADLASRIARHNGAAPALQPPCPTPGSTPLPSAHSTEEVDEVLPLSPVAHSVSSAESTTAISSAPSVLAVEALLDDLVELVAEGAAVPIAAPTSSATPNDRPLRPFGLGFLSPGLIGFTQGQCLAVRSAAILALMGHSTSAPDLSRPARLASTTGLSHATVAAGDAVPFMSPQLLARVAAPQHGALHPTPVDDLWSCGVLAVHYALAGATEKMAQPAGSTTGYANAVDPVEVFRRELHRARTPAERGAVVQTAYGRLRDLGAALRGGDRPEDPVVRRAARCLLRRHSPAFIADVGAALRWGAADRAESPLGQRVACDTATDGPPVPMRCLYYAPPPPLPKPRRTLHPDASASEAAEGSELAARPEPSVDQLLTRTVASLKLVAERAAVSDSGAAATSAAREAVCAHLLLSLLPDEVVTVLFPEAALGVAWPAAASAVAAGEVAPLDGLLGDALQFLGAPPVLLGPDAVIDRRLLRPLPLKAGAFAPRCAVVAERASFLTALRRRLREASRRADAFGPADATGTVPTVLALVYGEAGRRRGVKDAKPLGPEAELTPGAQPRPCRVSDTLAVPSPFAADVVTEIRRALLAHTAVAGAAPLGAPCSADAAAVQALRVKVRGLLAVTKCRVPAVLRLELWAALLGVPSPRHAEHWFSRSDSFAATACDRQIAVDIPRCHQYHPLLRTAAGHTLIGRALKAWLCQNPELKYWQGVHDVCAPLLGTGMHDLPLVVASLSALVRRLVPHFFRDDAMRRRLQLSSDLLWHHDPQLAVHLQDRECRVDMFAVSWALTLFAHVLPMERLYPTWDAVLLSDDPVGHLAAVFVAVVRSCRYQLLDSDFSQCVALLFSVVHIGPAHTVDEAATLAAALPAGFGSWALSPVAAALSASWGHTVGTEHSVVTLPLPLLLAAFNGRSYDGPVLAATAPWAADGVVLVHATPWTAAEVAAHMRDADEDAAVHRLLGSVTVATDLAPAEVPHPKSVADAEDAPPPPAVDPGAPTPAIPWLVSVPRGGRGLAKEALQRPAFLPAEGRGRRPLIAVMPLLLRDPTDHDAALAMRAVLDVCERLATEDEAQRVVALLPAGAHGRDVLDAPWAAPPPEEPEAIVLADAARSYHAACHAAAPSLMLPLTP